MRIRELFVSRFVRICGIVCIVAGLLLFGYAVSKCGCGRDATVFPEDAKPSPYAMERTNVERSPFMRYENSEVVCYNSAGDGLWCHWKGTR